MRMSCGCQSELLQGGYAPRGATAWAKSCGCGADAARAARQFCPPCGAAPRMTSRGANKQMTGPEVLDVSRDAIVTLLLVASPLMLVGLIVGVVISLFQALTQIQETTLVFVPKILAIFLAMLVTLPFMADTLHSNFLRIAARIISG